MRRLYQIYDKKSRSVEGPIFPKRHDGAAIREFHELLANPQTQLSKYPDDFDLLCVGVQDDSGKISVTETVDDVDLVYPVIVAQGFQWLEVQQRASLVDPKSSESDK